MILDRMTLRYHTALQPPRLIFHALRVQFPDRGMVTITGDSGIGKTSLLKIIAGQIKLTSGRFVHQGHSQPLFVDDHMRLTGTWLVKDYIVASQQTEFFHQTGLSQQQYHQRIDTLSVGQYTRLLMYVMLQVQTTCFLLDEPTHALDLVNRQRIIQLLRVHRHRALIIISTHDPLVVQASDYELHLYSPYQSQWINRRSCLTLQ